MSLARRRALCHVELVSLLLKLLRWTERRFSFLVGLFVCAKIILTLITIWARVLLFQVGLFKLRLYEVLLEWCIVLIEVRIDLNDWCHLGVVLHQRGRAILTDHEFILDGRW